MEHIMGITSNPNSKTRVHHTAQHLVMSCVEYVHVYNPIKWYVTVLNPS